MNTTEQNTPEELIFGYDQTPRGVIVNQAEATVVQYVYERRIELALNPPEKLVNEVLDEYAERGETISAEDAKKIIPDYKLLLLIEEEVKAKWPAEYESLLKKQNYNRSALDCKLSSGRTFANGKKQCEPLISQDEWDKVQSQIAASQSNN